MTRAVANLEAEILRGSTLIPHGFEFCEELTCGDCDTSIRVGDHPRREDAAEVEIPCPVTEPPAHLHECVVHPRRTEVVAYGQSLEGEPAGELGPADHDRGQPLVIVREIVERVRGSSVDHSNVDLPHGLC